MNLLAQLSLPKSRTGPFVDLVSTEPSLEEFFLTFFGEPKPKALTP